jgi:hypothetical protein
MSGLPTRTLCRMPLFLQFFQKRIPVVALNLNRPVFHRATRATFLFELFGQFLQAVRIERDTRDDRDAFAFAPLGFASHSHYPIAFGNARGLAADARRLRLAARRAHAAVVGGIYSARLSSGNSAKTTLLA